MKRTKSIFQVKDGRCWLCMREGDYSRKTVFEHHIYGGKNRTVSEREGFKAYLCLFHHTEGKEAVHNNIVNMRALQRACQKAYENNHSHEDFMRLIGENYDL